MLQLVKAHESDLTLLLVEEPEAHLHPQLQMVLLSFLRQQAEASSTGTIEGLHPAGRVQVIVTSHSPNLASAVSVRNLVVVARELDGDVWRTTATALCGLDLTHAQVRKVDRYLTATRAALLFARHVVLVEGIAEMLLLPSLAGRHLSPTAGSEGDSFGSSAARIRQFQAATLVSVEGVDFDPYLSLLLRGAHRRVDKVVLVTDGDKGAGEKRRAKYEAAYGEAVADGRLKVCVGGTTLEAELFALADNEAVLKAAFIELHPLSAEKWAKVAEAAADKTPAERAALFAAAIGKRVTPETPSLDLSKGDFAHLVAEALDGTGANLDDTSDGTLPILQIPVYLTDAIDAVSEIDSQT
ncbi:ATP-dependent nuclease [Nocardioides sp. BYT-33-1]|uniref:ATP-dependent nuclease n=1 Tax=Nocardioides sp. BYT-33-1 TaxID=3416952 RepID=UPI003F53CBDC